MLLRVHDPSAVLTAGLILLIICLSVPPTPTEAAIQIPPGPTCYKCDGKEECLLDDPADRETCQMEIDGCLTMYVPSKGLAEKRCLCFVERECLAKARVTLSPGFCKEKKEVDWATYHACLRNPDQHPPWPTDKEIQQYEEKSFMKHVFCYCEGDLCNSNVSLPYVNSADRFLGGRRPLLKSSFLAILLLFNL